MYITPARKEVIDFSDPVYTYGEGLIVAKSDTKDYKTLEDLKGETVGAQVGTAYVEPLKKTGLFADVKIYDTIPDIMRDVNAGRIKAGFGDFPILAYNLQQGNFPEVRLVKNYKSDHRGLGRHRRAQGRRRAAEEDQRVARQAQGRRHGRQDPRQVGPGPGVRPPIDQDAGRVRDATAFSEQPMQRFIHDSVEFLPILLLGVKLPILVTVGSLAALDACWA